MHPQQRPLTMQRMLVHVQMMADPPPLKRAMHLNPHERAVHHMILPGDPGVAFAPHSLLAGDGGVADFVGVPDPGCPGVEVGAERCVVAFGRLPGEGDEVEGAAAGAGGGGRGAAGGVRGVVRRRRLLLLLVL